VHNEEVDVSTDQPLILTDEEQNLIVTSGLGVSVTEPEQVIEITQSGMLSFYETGASGDGYMSNQGPNTTKFGGFAADRNFVRVHLSWIETNVPNYHRMTRVYRAKSNDFLLAECIGDSETQAFTDTVEPGVDYFYWLVGETYAGKQTEHSLGLSVAATEDSNFLLDLLGLKPLIDDLATLEDKLNSSYIGAYLNLEELAAQNLASNISLINDSIATVTSNMVQIEQRLGLESENALALLEEQLTIAVDESNALIERVNTLTAKVTTETEERLAQITRLELAQVTADSALTQARDELNASIANERSLREASVVAERTARVNAVEVVASSVESLNTTFQTEIAITNAAIDSERIARTTANAATAQQITDISTGFDTARAELDSRITQELTSQSTATEAVASALTELETQVTTDLARVESNVTEELNSYSDELESVAGQMLTLEANFQGLSGSLSQTNALITEESTTRANEYEALAQRTSKLEADFSDTDNGQLVARIESEETARADEDGALSLRIDELDTKYTGKDSTTNARITDEVKALSDADQALSTRTSTLEASYEELDNEAIRALVDTETTARTTQDQALAKDITDLSAQMDTDIGTAKAEAEQYTLSVVGYCTIGGTISDDTTQESCEANSGTWSQLPLSEAMDRVSVSITKPDGTVVKGNAGSFFQALTDDVGNISTRAFLGTDVNGRVTGVVATDSSGDQSQRKLDLLGSKVNILNDETLQPFISFDTVNKRGVIRGQLILDDGTSINGEEDIRGFDGKDGADGSIGPQGPVGATGPTGAKGADGSDGADGKTGPGFYTIINASGLFPSNSTASNDFKSNFGHTPRNHDHLTYRKSDNSASTTKRFNGTSWIAPTLTVHGDLLTKGTVTAEAINVEDLFAQTIEATGTISGLNLTGARIEARNTSSGKSVLLDSGLGSPIIVNDGTNDVLRFDSNNKLILDAGLGAGTIDDPSVFSQAIWDQIRMPVTEGSTGGSFTGPDRTGQASTAVDPVENELISTVTVTPTNEASVAVSFRFYDKYHKRQGGNTLTNTKWNLAIGIQTRSSSSAAWSELEWVRISEHNGVEDSYGFYITELNIAQSFNIEDLVMNGQCLVTVKITNRDFAGWVAPAGSPKLSSVTAIQQVQGGGAAGAASTLNGQEGSFYLDYGNFTGQIPLGHLPQRIADFNDGTLTNTYTFNNSTYFNKPQVFSRDGISGVVEQHVHSDNYLRFRHGGTSDIKGLSISNYDTVNIYLTREGTIKAREFKNWDGAELPNQHYKTSGTDLNNYSTKLTSFNTISDSSAIGLGGWQHVIHMHHNDNNGYAGQIALGFGTSPPLRFRGAGSTGFGAWSTVWTDRNDGAGSGLDADKLDGYHASSFMAVNGDYGYNMRLGRYIYLRDYDDGDTPSGIKSFVRDGVWRLFKDTDTPANIDINLDGNYVYHQGRKPTYGELGTISTDHVNFTNQYLNTGSSPTFNNGTFTGELLVENAQPWLRLNDTTGNDARIRNQSSVVYFDANGGSGNATVAVGSLRAGSAFIGAADGPYLYRSNATDHTFAIRTGTSDARKYYVFHGSKSQMDIGGHKVWTAGNDGSGSGLDADMLDGVHASSFARKPNDHTSNNTDYSLVWENNGGTLYTSTSHLKYNPALRRISAGALRLSGVNNDMLTLDSTGHANLVIDRASTSYDNNILFKTAGALKWRLWMGAGDDHIAFRHEPSGTQPVAIYERIIGFQGKRAFRFDDSWLRVNDAGDFSNGIYCASSILRTDGHLQVGSSGAAFNASTSQIDLKVTTRVHNKLHVREIVSQDGNFTTIGAGELGNSLRGHVIDTHGTGHEGLHLGGESGVYLYAHPNNMSGGMAASYSIRPIASDGATYINHLDVYKDQNNASQVVARFRHPSQNANVAIVSKNNDAGSFRLEANMEGQDLRIQTANTSGDYYTSSISVGTIARFFRNGDMKVTREVTAQDFIATSDRRVKDKLKSIEGSLGKVAKLHGYTYDQLKLNERKAGIIAQDVKKVLPEAIGEDSEGMLNVSPMALVGLLVNAINELSSKVTQLEKGVN